MIRTGNPLTTRATILAPDIVPPGESHNGTRCPATRLPCTLVNTPGSPCTAGEETGVSSCRRDCRRSVKSMLSRLSSATRASSSEICCLNSAIRCSMSWRTVVSPVLCTGFTDTAPTDSCTEARHETAMTAKHVATYRPTRSFTSLTRHSESMLHLTPPIAISIHPQPYRVQVIRNTPMGGGQ